MSLKSKEATLWPNWQTDCLILGSIWKFFISFVKCIVSVAFDVPDTTTSLLDALLLVACLFEEVLDVCGMSWYKHWIGHVV